MSRENSQHVPAGTSVEILLAEHQRLSTLYLHNVEMGEKRTTSYLTLVSIGSAIVVGMSQRKEAQDFLIWASFGLVTGAFIFGLLTFQRLLERRIRAIEYLRAINRIHRFFVLIDPTIRDYFYWSAYDDVPTFLVRGTTMAGLRDLVSFFNSLFAGVVVGGIILIKWPDTYKTAFASLLTIFLVVLLFHLRYEKRTLSRFEKRAAKDVKFPGDKS